LDWTLGENKPNLLAFGVLRSADSVKMRKSNLKKQSQFTKGQNKRNIYMKGHYEDFCGFWLRKNKPNQSQMSGFGWKSDTKRMGAE